MEVKLGHDGVSTLPPPKSRVFVTQDVRGLRFDDLNRYGSRIEYLVSNQIFPDTGEHNETWLPAELQRRLADFNPELDYVAPAGDPLVMAATFFVLGQRHRKVRVLKYDKVYGGYWEFTVDLG